MKRYVILGGGCCFALHTAQLLLEDPTISRVISVGRSPPSMAGFIASPRHEYVTADVLDTGAIMALLRTCMPHVIINFAAEAESSASFRESWKYFETNAVALSRLVEAIAGGLKLNRFVQVSSGEVYGSVDAPALETDLLNPTSPYAASKAAFDHYLLALYRKTVFPAVILRPCNVYGEGQQAHRVVPRAIMAGLAGERMPLHGCGLGQKTYMHVSDLALGVKAAAERGPLGRVYNLATRHPISIRDLVGKIAALMGKSLTDIARDEGLRRGTDARYWFDCCAAAREIGWAPQTSLDVGLMQTIEWTRSEFSREAA